MSHPSNAVHQIEARPLNLSILILSWKSHKTLINTLESYKKNGLLDLAKQKIIYFQEISKKDRKIASQYDLECIGNSKNIGIGYGLYELACKATSKHILFLENDWELICPENETNNKLLAGMKILENNRADVIRYRHRQYYGPPNHALQFEGKELSVPYCLMESLYWLKDPELKFPDYIKKDQMDSEYFYIASSKNANFTNNPTMYIREFYVNLMKPFLKEKFEPESAIQKWWEKQGYIIAQGEGLFCHNRLDRPGRLVSKLRAAVERMRHAFS